MPHVARDRFVAVTFCDEIINEKKLTIAAEVTRITIAAVKLKIKVGFVKGAIIESR